jgi:hypothetical protein
MSEDRLRELGIPRRGFLKKTATAAFVAPVVVSFGLDGIAEADTGSFSNQFCPNQVVGNQLLPNIEHDTSNALFAIFEQVEARALDVGPAHSLSAKLVRSAIEALAGNNRASCAELSALSQEVAGLETVGQISPQLASELNQIIRTLEAVEGCGCLTPVLGPHPPPFDPH